MVIQGVKQGQKYPIATIWTILGFPLTTLVTPVWVDAGNQLPQWVVSKNGALPEINDKSLKLKSIFMFPISIGRGTDYLNVAAVMNQAGTGLYQHFIPKERVIREKAKKLLDSWHNTGFNKSQAQSFYLWLDQYLANCYNSIH